MKTIKLPLGLSAIVDDNDYDTFSRSPWGVYYSHSSGPYAYNYRLGFLHLRIMGKPKHGMVVDHINRNTLDNTRGNLRFVTKARSCSNRLRKNESGNPPGIYEISPENWRARLKSKSLYRPFEKKFKTKEKAAEAYRMAYLATFGEEHPFYRLRP